MAEAPGFVPAGPEDAEAMAAMALDIWRRCWCPSVLTAEEIEYFWRRAYRPEVLREHMNNGAVYEWIEADGRNAGFVAYSVEAEHNRLQLGKLYLLPEYHGRGIGSEALARLQKLSGKSSDAFGKGGLEHGDADDVLGGAGEDFEVLAQSAKSAEPGEGPFHNPALR
jgi:GNAT superfamily N-acetyltransferase